MNIKHPRANPGSEEARNLGCKCPVIDNHFGKGRLNGDFIYSGDCEYHTLPNTTKK